MQIHPAQWVGLRALIRGLGVGGRKVKAKVKVKAKESKRESRLH